MDFHLDTPMSKDCGDPRHGERERPAAGKCLWFLSLLVWVLSLLGWFFIIIEVVFYHYWVFPLYFSVPKYQLSRSPKLFASSGSAREAKGTPTHMETAGNEQDTENTPKTHSKHLRHPKTRQNDPISNRICEGKFTPVWRKQHRRESQPWQLSIIPLKSILLGQQVGIQQIFVGLKELRGFGLSSPGSAQPLPKASNAKQKEKRIKAKETRSNLHISSV